MNTKSKPKRKDLTELEVSLKKITEYDVVTLIEKEKVYRGSWKKRGGIGAFMMLARKWDRIENQCCLDDYDIFQSVSDCFVDGVEDKDGLLDDIRDLRCYLLLVEQEVRRVENVRLETDDEAVYGEPSPDYVQQD